MRLQILSESLCLVRVSESEDSAHGFRLPFVAIFGPAPLRALLGGHHLDAAHLLVARIGLQVSVAVLAVVPAFVHHLLECFIGLFE